MPTRARVVTNQFIGGSHGHLCSGRIAGGRVDTLSRLSAGAWFGVLFVALVWPVSARAAGLVPYQSGMYYTVDQGSTRHGQGGTPGEACSAWAAAVNVAGYTGAIDANGHCIGYYNGAYDTDMGIPAAHATSTCPANSGPTAPVSASCGCSAGFQPSSDGLTCVPPPDKCASSLAQPLTGEVSAAVAGQIIPSKVCSGGCGYIPTGAVAAPAGGGMGSGFWTKLAGQYTFRGNGADWIGDGTSCTGAPVGSNGPPGTPPTPDPTPPPPGMCRGTVNGAVVTVPCDGTSSTSGSSGSGSGGTGPVGSASSPAGTVPGTSSSGTDTSCANGTCSTTTTTKTNKADGTTTTGTSVATTGQDTFCKANPGDPNCAASKSAFGGSCAAATCSGDAVQCQIAKEQARRNCATLDAAAATDPAVIAAAAGIQPADHPYSLRTTVALPGSGGFDQTDILSGGCPADLSVSITAGRSVVIPFSKLCDPAVILGRVLVGITALSCIGIVFVRGS